MLGSFTYSFIIITTFSRVLWFGKSKARIETLNYICRCYVLEARSTMQYVTRNQELRFNNDNILAYHGMFTYYMVC